MRHVLVNVQFNINLLGVIHCKSGLALGGKRVRGRPNFQPVLRVIRREEDGREVLYVYLEDHRTGVGVLSFLTSSQVSHAQEGTG